MSSYHGWTHAPKSQGGTDPIPVSDPTVMLFNAQSGTDLAAAYTTLVWSDSVYPTSDSVAITVNGSGNIEIASAGAYLLMLYSEDWSLPTDKGAQVDYDIRTIAGSAGYWSTVGSSPQIGATALLALDEQSGTAIGQGSGAPDVSALALWQSSATFPAEIRVQAKYSEDTVAVAASTPTFRLAIARLGAAFE